MTIDPLPRGGQRGLGPFYRGIIAVDSRQPWGPASAAYRLEVLARTLPFPVVGARLVPSNNNDVWRLASGYLRVAWRGDRGRLAREAQLLGKLLGLLPVPEVLDFGGDERLSWSLTAPMPGTPLDDLCVRPAPPGLRGLAREVATMLRALHSWAVPEGLAATLRSSAAAGRLRELGNLTTADGLDPAHPLRTLRRLIDAPLTPSWR